MTDQELLQAMSQMLRESEERMKTIIHESEARTSASIQDTRSMIQDSEARMSASIQDTRSMIQESEARMKAMIQESEARMSASIQDTRSMIQESEARTQALMKEELKEAKKELHQEIMKDVTVLMDIEFKSKFNLLAEGQQAILDRLPDPEFIETTEYRLRALEISVKKLNREVKELKQAN